MNRKSRPHPGDTSEINLEGHRGRLKPDDVGVVGNNRDLGFFIHPTLVLDAQDGFPLGLSHVQLWTRAIDHGSKHSNSKFGMFILHRQKCRNMYVSRFSFSVNITQSFL